MTRLNKPILSLLIAGLLVPAAFAGNKETPHDSLMKSFQQANLWSGGPTKLAVNMTFPKPDGSSVSLDYTLSWAGPDKWRAEWTANGLDQVTVLNNNKLSYMSTQADPLFRLVLMEAAVAALDGGNPAGPYTIAPLDLEKADIDISKKKVNGVDARCMTLGDPQQTFCIDPETHHLLSATISSHSAEIASFEYSDYTTAGDTQYPQTIKVTYEKSPLEQAKLTVSRGDKFADSVFAAPAKSSSTDFSSCADVATHFTAPHVDKSVPAKMPEADRKAKKYGVVWVLAKVGKDGSVTKAFAAGSDNPDLNTAATDAVQQYKFAPYSRCGQAVEFQTLVLVPFTPTKMPDLPQQDVGR